jgi:F-type H+-transporting ATPase subunit b
MKRLLLLLIATFGLSLALAAPPAYAAPEDEAGHSVADTTHADDGAHGTHAKQKSIIASPKEGLFSFIAALIVFGLVFTFLALKVWPKILSGLDEREGKIRKEIESAEDARRQANEALEEYQKNLAEAKAEAAAMIEKTRAEQAALAAELKAKAEAELTEIRVRATADIEAAKRGALNEIYAEMANLATGVAGKILAREINPDDHRQLVDDALGKLNDATRN